MKLFENLFQLYQEYKKTVMALGAALVVTGAALQDGAVTQAELVAIGGAWTGVYAVWKARNVPQKG